MKFDNYEGRHLILRAQTILDGFMAMAECLEAEGQKQRSELLRFLGFEMDETVGALAALLNPEE